ncbi:hypothetical protein PAXRUDRAFT_830300 [Paxillus rubicundulus Ve08.2h10]|uniref:Uncharacterized protein n=1 Tax=Paxillus rubicundulus Ve08.2h10 TaxID=930991 RepID=A0A0D0DZ22_9AGAM|nr:hypothetical protein PAXRUDRAFT_830300 [Paxillus rubicundulus Ve08.2h10]
MRLFATLLASIVSLSAYTLVNVHAGCAICPPAVANKSLLSHCTNSFGDTFCYYDSDGKYCSYEEDGERLYANGYDDSTCPQRATSRAHDCRAC